MSSRHANQRRVRNWIEEQCGGTLAGARKGLPVLQHRLLSALAGLSASARPGLDLLAPQRPRSNVLSLMRDR